MRGQCVQVEYLHVGHGARFHKAGYAGVDHRPRPSANDKIIRAQEPTIADSDDFWRNEPRLSTDEFDIELFEKILKPIHRLHHLGLALLHQTHVRLQVLGARNIQAVSVSHSRLMCKIRCMYDVLGR